MRVLMITSDWHPNPSPFIVRQVEFLRCYGVKLDVMPFIGRKRPANYLRGHRWAHNLMATGRYDLVHAQHGQEGILALFPDRLPLVVTFRGSDLEGIVAKDGRYTLQGKVLPRVSRLVAWRAAEIIVTSANLARLLPRRPCSVIPSGLDFRRFQPMPQAEARQELGLPRDGRLILFGGNPTRAVKRFPLAAKAVDLVEVNFPGVRLITVQGISHDQMHLYMNACDLLLLTSLHEGSPNVVKEALACDRPVVSVPVGDVPERIGSIEGCLVCSDDSAEAISAALSCVLAEGRSRVDGRRAVMDLDENILTRKLISVYERAICRKAA